MVKHLSSDAEAHSFSNQSLELVHGLQDVKKAQSLIGNSCPLLMANVTIQLSVVGYRLLATSAIDYRLKPISTVKPHNMWTRVPIGYYT